VPVLDRYVVRELISPFLFGGALFTFFLVIDRIYQLTELRHHQGCPVLPGRAAPGLHAAVVPRPHAADGACLVAVLLAGGRLAGDLEIIAFKAAGVSTLRLFRPVMAAALVVAAVTATITLVINPIANREFQRQLFKILQARATSGLAERVFNPTFGDVIIYVEDVSASQVALRGLLVSDERDNKISRIITAREGRLLTDEENRRITLRLINGAVSEADVLPAAPAVPTTNLKEMRPPAQRRGQRRPLPSHQLQHLRHESLGGLPAQVVVEGGEAREGSSAGRPRERIEELKNDRYAQAPVQGRVAQAVRVSRWPRWCSRSWPSPLAGALASRRPLDRAGRQPGHPGRLLRRADLARRAGPAHAGAGVAGHLDAQHHVHGHRHRAADRHLAGVADALAARAVEGAERGGAGHSPAPARARCAPTVGGRDSTHILDRYLVRELLAFMAIGLAVAGTLFVVVDLLQTLDRFIRNKPPLIFVLEHFVYRLPAALQQGLPVVMLVATIFLFLALTRAHELTAMKAAGHEPLPGGGPRAAPGRAGGADLRALPGAAAPAAQRARRRGGQREDPGQPAAPPPVARAAVAAHGGQPLLSRRAAEPAASDMYGVTVLEVDQKTFRLKSRLDARRAHWTPGRLGAHRRRLPGVRARRRGADHAVRHDRPSICQDEIDAFTKVQKQTGA
jgi:lipopolysaccharide export LptBFGC system permease protein LptF